MTIDPISGHDYVNKTVTVYYEIVQDIGGVSHKVLASYYVKIEPIPVKAIELSISPEIGNILVNNIVTIDAKVIPDNSTHKIVSWTVVGCEYEVDNNHLVIFPKSTEKITVTSSVKNSSTSMVSEKLVITPNNDVKTIYGVTYDMGETLGVKNYCIVEDDFLIGNLLPGYAVVDNPVDYSDDYSMIDYKFKGWKVGNQNVYPESYPIYQDVKFTAQWEVTKKFEGYTIVHKNDDLFKLLTTDLNGKFVLASDYNISVDNWGPTGTFTGTFDGNGHTITGLRFEGKLTGGTWGLFGETNNATISNLTISSPFVKLTNTNSDVKVGFITGNSYGKTDISNCIVTNGLFYYETEWGLSNIGGIAGVIGGDSTITNCNVNNVSIISKTKEAHCGGIGGTAIGKSTVTNCMVSSCIIQAWGHSYWWDGVGYAGGILGEKSSSAAERDNSVSNYSLRAGHHYLADFFCTLKVGKFVGNYY